MNHPHVEERNSNYYVQGSRVSLESIITVWSEGHSPEEIRDAFPTLDLVEVYAAIAYYLDHQAEMDQLFREHEIEYQAQRAAAEAADPERYAQLRQRFAEARKRLQASPQSSRL